MACPGLRGDIRTAPAGLRGRRTALNDRPFQGPRLDPAERSTRNPRAERQQEPFLLALNTQGSKLALRSLTLLKPHSGRRTRMSAISDHRRASRTPENIQL